MRKLFCVSLILIFAASAHAQAAVTPAPAAVTADQLARLERAENRLKDWPNFARYRDANAALAPPAKTEDRVVFMGDSITDSWKLNEYFPGKSYINRGISGQTTPQMLIRFRPDVIALKPRVVVILAGTNDLAGNTGPMSLEDIQGNIASMAELARANGIRVVIASVLPINDYAKNREGTLIVRSAARPPEKILALNKWIREYSAANKLIYLDYFPATADEKGFLKAELAGDGLHPNPAGYQVMKPLAEKAIADALKQKK
jgi:lysophospholipase L1-like esterase